MLKLDEAPNGVVGYNVNLTIEDPSIARITRVDFPSWASLHSSEGLSEGKDVRLMAVDLLRRLEAGAMDVPLASVTIQGLINGSTTVHLGRDRFEDDNEGSIPRTLVDGNISVGTLTPSTGPTPIPIFTGLPLSGSVPLNVTFTDMTTESPTSWNWSFGDGNFSELQNPFHVYSAARDYTVSLNVTNVFGSNTTTIMNYITVTAPATNPTVTLESGHIPIAGQEITVQLSLNEAPEGLVGYYINLTVDDTRVAKITGATFPSWAILQQSRGLEGGKEVLLSCIGGFRIT